MERQSKQQQALQRGELKWFAGKIKMGKRRGDIVNFVCQGFKVYFPAGEDAVSKRMPGLNRAKRSRWQGNIAQTYTLQQSVLMGVPSGCRIIHYPIFRNFDALALFFI